MKLDTFLKGNIILLFMLIYSFGFAIGANLTAETLGCLVLVAVSVHYLVKGLKIHNRRMQLKEEKYVNQENDAKHRKFQEKRH